MEAEGNSTALMTEVLAIVRGLWGNKDVRL